MVVKRLDVNVYSVLDTVKTSRDGSFSYALSVKEGQPEFIYLFYGDTRVAALLLEKGEKVTVKADTLGAACTISGSEGSEKLQEVEGSYARFVRAMASTEKPSELTKAYVAHYRECVRYVLSNPRSLTVVPVLYESVNNLPVFAQATDAVLFRAAADSLQKVYPDSRYVKALAKETERRENALQLNAFMKDATTLGYPDLLLPDLTGAKVALSSLDAKVVLLHFWSASDAAQSLFNTEVLLPVYNDFKGKGFEIYSVCLDPDKSNWAAVVKGQNLPWVNVNDGKGAACPAVTLYNVSEVPVSVILSEGNLVTEPVNGEAGLRALLRKLLR